MPDFAGLNRRLPVDGYLLLPSSGGYRDPVRDIAFWVQEGPSAGATCSMTFATNDSADEVRTAFSALGTFGETDLGMAALYRDTSALMFLNAPIDEGDRLRVNIRLQPER